MPKTRFTEADVRRAVQGAKDGGIEAPCVEILPDGTIRVLPAPVEVKTDKGTPLPEW